MLNIRLNLVLMGILSILSNQLFSQSTNGTGANSYLSGRHLGFDISNGTNPLEIKVNGITRMHFNGTGTGYGVNTWGFIGVGTSSPASPLHVVGSQQQNAQGWMRGITLSNSASLIWDGIGGSSFFMTHPSGTPNGNWFAGSQTSLNSSAPVDYAFTVFVNNTLGTNPLRSTMFYKNLLVYEDAFERRFGVNTITPTRAAEIKSNLNQAPQLRLTTTNNNWSDLETNANGNLLLRPMSQRVGINLTTNPTANLDVNGDVRIRNVQAATPNSILIGVNANGSSDVNVRRLDFNGNASTVLSGNGTWVTMNTNSGPGNYCGAGVPPFYLPNALTADYQMELAGKNYYFTSSTVMPITPTFTQRVGVGHNCNTPLQGKIDVIERGRFNYLETMPNQWITMSIAGKFHQASSETNIGVGLWTESHSTTSNYGIFATVPSGPNNWGAWVNGTTHCTAGIWTTSDQNLKENIHDFQDANAILSQLHSVRYTYRTEEFPQINFSEGPQIGLLAQELEEVLPEAVRETTMPAMYDTLGNMTSEPVTFKAVSYEKLIPILVTGHQEQQSALEQLQTENADLKAQLNELNAKFNQLEACLMNRFPDLCSISQGMIQQNSTETQQQLIQSIEVNLSSKNAIILNQNVPNPFAESTVITYSVPTSIAKAQIHFYDGQGKLIQSVDITGGGNGQLNVFGSDLSSGTYSYSLVADGKIIDTKKMVKQ